MSTVTAAFGFAPLVSTNRGTTAPIYTRLGGGRINRYAPAFSLFVGPASIAGTTYVEGTPDTLQPNTRVLLIDEATGERVAETRSDAAGAYSFVGLAKRPMFPIAIDDVARHYDPAAVLGVTPTE